MKLLLVIFMALNYFELKWNVDLAKPIVITKSTTVLGKKFSLQLAPKVLETFDEWTTNDPVI